MRNYVKPEIEMILLSPAEDVLRTSNEEVFVDGGDLFD